MVKFGAEAGAEAGAVVACHGSGSDFFAMLSLSSSTFIINVQMCIVPQFFLSFHFTPYLLKSTTCVCDHTTLYAAPFCIQKQRRVIVFGGSADNYIIK